MKPYRSATATQAAIAEVLAETKRRPGQPAPLDKAVAILTQGRKYLWAGVYLFVGGEVVCATAIGPTPSPHRLAFVAPTTEAAGDQVRVLRPGANPGYLLRFAESKSEAIVPLKIGGRIVGVLDLESERETAFSPNEQAFLKEVASTLAAFLTGRGKYMLKRAGEALAQRESQLRVGAAVGEKSRQ